MTTQAEKPRFFLGKIDHLPTIEELSSMFEKITGRRPTEAELAEVRQSREQRAQPENPRERDRLER